jgi:hypothetical protein
MDDPPNTRTFIHSPINERGALVMDFLENKIGATRETHAVILHLNFKLSRYQMLTLEQRL